MRLDAMRLQAGALQAASEAEDDLSSLLAKVLLMFTLDFEAASKLSLPISANALRVLDELGKRRSRCRSACWKSSVAQP